MTAGSGILHTETIEKIAKMRLLQLWRPKKDRAAVPRLRELPLEHVPALSENGVTIKLYSGNLAGLNSPVQNYSPIIIAYIILDAGTTTVQQIPADYNTFLYIIPAHKSYTYTLLSWIFIISKIIVSAKLLPGILFFIVTNTDSA